MNILKIRENRNSEWKEIPAIKGDKGADGKTPVKGVDYFTEADKQELVDAVLSALPIAEGGTF